MSELTSKSEITPSVEATSSSRGFDPDRRVAERFVDEDHLSTAQEGHKIDPDARIEGSSVSFKGFRDTERIADIQSGRNCSYEAMENLAQLQIGDKDGLLNDLSDKFHQFVKTHPERFDATDRGWWGYWHNDRWYVDMAKYPEILKEVGVEARAMPFSHSELQRALAENRAVIIGGDVVHLPPYNGQVGGHALVVVDWNPDNGGSYTLLDSNSRSAYSVSADAIEKFAKSTEAYEGGISMVVAEKPSSWPWKTSVEDPKILDVFSDYEKFLGRVSDEINKRKSANVSFKGRIESADNGGVEGSENLSKRFIGMFEGVAKSVGNFIKQFRSKEESAEDFAKRIKGMSTEDLVKESGKLGKGIHELYEQTGGWQGALQRKMDYYERFKQNLEDSMTMFMRSLPDDPKALRQIGNRIQNEIEVLKAKRHEQEIRQEMSDLARAKASNMTIDQYRSARANGLTKLPGPYPWVSSVGTAFSDQYGNLTKVGFDGTVTRILCNGSPVRV